MARDYLTRSRHGTLYYFRRRVPDDLRAIILQPYLVCSLGTSHRGRAIILARAYAAKTDNAFTQLRTMSEKKLTATEILDNFANDPNCRLRIRLAGAQLRIEEKEREADRLEREVIEGLYQQQMQQKQHERELDVAIRISAARVSPAEHPATPTPTITAQALLDDFFREGEGDERWKDVEAARTRDYGPIWRKFAKHADVHGLTVAAAKAYRAEVLAEGVSSETKKRNLYRAHAVIAHGVEQHDLDPKILLPLKKPKGKGRGKGSGIKSYLPFSEDELRLLFHSESYKNNSFKKASNFWLPLLGLYTGARLEELAGFHLSAFATVEGLPAMLLSDHETTDEGKNEHALRYVPIHPELLKAGLLEYAELLKEEGHSRLFPEIRAAARDGYAKRATADFTAYRRSVGVGKDKGERSREVFHSFRATMSGKLFHLGVDGDLSRRLTGHAAKDVHEGTYLGAVAIPMARATEVMSRVSFGLEHSRFADTEAYKKARNRKPTLRGLAGT